MTVKMRSFEDQKMIADFLNISFNEIKARECAGRIYDIQPHDLLRTVGLIRLEDDERSFWTETFFIEKFIDRRNER